MRALNYLKCLLRQPRLVWPTALHVIDAIRIRRSGRGTALPPCPLADQEVMFFQHRAGWLIDHIREHGLASAHARYAEMIAQPRLLEDAYSASQRLAKLTYLHKLSDQAALPQTFLERARKDANLVARHYEFRTNNTWFNNHLLNNYRALLLYASYFMDSQDAPNIKTAIHEIGAILERYRDTLFESPGEPVLCEGSVSYEIHGLKILADMAACAYRTPLSDLWREWVVTRGRAVLMKYRYQDRWLIPQIGDITPNWTTTTMIDFMNGLALPDSGALYRAVWADEFSRLGI